MRYLTYFTADNNRIDVTNDLLTGVEKIYYNGTMVSRKWSFFGSRHIFHITEGETDVTYEVAISIKPLLRIGFDLFRNGKALLLS